MITDPTHPDSDPQPIEPAAEELEPCPDDGENATCHANAQDPPLTPEQEAAVLRAALSEAQEEIARQVDAVQRGRADLANARRRHDDERLSIQQMANSRLLVQLLPIVDEFDLAINHLETNGADAGQGQVSESWVQGVRLIQRKLSGFLESQGVARIDALGEQFNPELHEAVGMTKVDGAESGAIIEVLRQGYRLHDRVVQVAQVVVNQ